MNFKLTLAAMVAALTTPLLASAGLKVAIVAPSASNDLAFTQSIVDGVNALKDEFELEVAITDGTFIVDDAAAAIRDYAKQGYDVVLAHGSQYGGSLKEIAPDFPDTAFAWGTSADTFGLPNVSSYEASSDQGGYVMGVMAGAMTQSGTIGIVGPIEVGDAKLYVDGFAAGAKAQNADAKVNINYIGSFGDVALSAEAGRAHIANGADVMTGTAQMVVGAVGAARSANVAWFGTQANQTKLGKKIVVASQVYKWEVILREIFNDAQNGVKGGKILKIDLANGGLQIEFNDGYALDADARAAGEAAMAGIIDGSITIGE
ncbi:MAG: BMP family protein [Granulosicoccus sp.]|nr:BMP family protein [Granulosicoccus sp.]